MRYQKPLDSSIKEELIMRSDLNGLDWIALVLAIVGAINWGLIGFFNFDLVAALFGDTLGRYGFLSRTVFSIVGIAGLWLIYTASKMAASDGEARE